MLVILYSANISMVTCLPTFYILCGKKVTFSMLLCAIAKLVVNCKSWFHMPKLYWFHVENVIA